MKKLLDLYIDSSIPVALSAAALCYVTGWYFGFVPPAYLTLALFCGTIVGYNYIKYAPLAPNFLSVRGAYLRGLQIFSALNFLIAGYLLTKFSNIALWCTGGIGLLVFFYVFPVHKFKGAIRNIRGVKVYVVALVWTLATVMLPALEEGLEFDAYLYIEILRRTLFILAITIPFEIRDLELDQPGLHTLPQQYGVRGARLIGYMGLLIFWVMGVWFAPGEGSGIWVREGILTGISMLLLAGASRGQHPYYSGLMVESLPMVWLLLLLF